MAENYNTNQQGSKKEFDSNNELANSIQKLKNQIDESSKLKESAEAKLIEQRTKLAEQESLLEHNKESDAKLNRLYAKYEQVENEERVFNAKAKLDRHLLDTSHEISSRNFVTTKLQIDVEIQECLAYNFGKVSDSNKAQSFLSSLDDNISNSDSTNVKETTLPNDLTALFEKADQSGDVFQKDVRPLVLYALKVSPHKWHSSENIFLKLASIWPGIKKKKTKWKSVISTTLSGLYKNGEHALRIEVEDSGSPLYKINNEKYSDNII